MNEISLNKSVQSLVIYHQLFQSAEETFLQIFNIPVKACKKNIF